MVRAGTSHRWGEAVTQGESQQAKKVSPICQDDNDDDDDVEAVATAVLSRILPGRAIALRLWHGRRASPPLKQPKVDALCRGRLATEGQRR